MGQELPVTSFALLGLLSFGDDLTGYELKQRADRTLRFYWVSPAMSQVYSELSRLAERGLVAPSGEGRGTTYSLTARGRQALTRWLESTPPGFPVLKHPVALRLMLGALVSPDTVRAMLESHLKALDAERAALAEVRESLRGADGVDEPLRYPSWVADWGLDYFANEQRLMEDLLRRLDD